jgi:hypothetical protein
MVMTDDQLSIPDTEDDQLSTPDTEWEFPFDANAYDHPMYIDNDCTPPATLRIIIVHDYTGSKDKFQELEVGCNIDCASIYSHALAFMPWSYPPPLQLGHGSKGTFGRTLLPPCGQLGMVLAINDKATVVLTASLAAWGNGKRANDGSYIEHLPNPMLTGDTKPRCHVCGLISPCIDHPVAIVPLGQLSFNEIPLISILLMET